MADVVAKELTVEDLDDIKALVEAGMQEEAQSKLLALSRVFQLLKRMKSLLK